MTLRSILVPLDGTDASRRSLVLGFSVAKKFDSHLSALHVRPDAKDTVPLLGEGMSVAMIEDMMEIAENEATSRAGRAREMFETVAAEYHAPIDAAPSAEGFSAALFEATGREDDAVAAFGRLSDLTVVARPTETSDVSANLTLNATLFETGRPVLVAPPETVEAAFGHVMISWNGSAQAARAVAAGMPLLKAAEKVSVCTVESARTSGDRGPELNTYLAWHGIDAEVRLMTGSRASVGPQLMEQIEVGGVDLLVMGAYTHSRMRQLILGGVTRHVLETAALPVFMIH